MANGNIYLLVTTAVFFWGANFVLGQFVLHDLSSLWTAALRFVLGTAVMFAIAGLRRERLFASLRRHLPAYLTLGVATMWNWFEDKLVRA